MEKENMDQPQEEFIDDGMSADFKDKREGDEVRQPQSAGNPGSGVKPGGPPPEPIPGPQDTPFPRSPAPIPKPEQGSE